MAAAKTVRDVAHRLDALDRGGVLPAPECGHALGERQADLARHGAVAPLPSGSRGQARELALHGCLAARGREGENGVQVVERVEAVLALLALLPFVGDQLEAPSHL